MGRFATETPVRVRVGDCTCPESPHPDGDYVTLKPRLSIEAGAAATERLSDGGVDTATVLAAILPHMIESWTFLDAQTGEPLPIDAESVREALPWNEGGAEVVGELLRRLNSPLPSKGSPTTNGKPSPSTRTASTSASRRSSSPRPARSG